LRLYFFKLIAIVFIGVLPPHCGSAKFIPHEDNLLVNNHIERLIYYAFIVQFQHSNINCGKIIIKGVIV
jgi:hypothetical protein